MAEEVIVAPDAGQATPAPVEGTGQAWQPLTLGEDTFNTREELEKAWKDSYQRRDDYTRKSQANAQLRKALEQREKEFEQRIKDHETKAQEFAKYDNFIAQRPDVYGQLQQMMNKPPSPEVAYQRAESLVNDKTGEIEERLAAFEEWKKQQEIEREKTDVYSRLSEEIEGFDRDAVEKRFASLADSDLETLCRTLHYAGIGEQSPLKVEQDITNKLKKKGGVKTASPKGAPTAPSDRVGNNIESARVQALKDAQGE
jgi:hypothetical protein